MPASSATRPHPIADSRRDERDFHDALHDWMSRAPWFAISALAHLLAFFVLAAVPWNDLTRDDAITLMVRPEPEPEPPLEPEPEVELPVELPPDEVVEPELVEVRDPVPADTPSDEPDAAPGDPDLFALLTPDADDALDELGIGGGGLGDGKRGGRFGRNGKGGGGRGTSPPVREGLEWLAAHQAPDGSWSAASFSNRCGALGATICDGAGSPVHDVGVSALALLAFLGDGHTTFLPGPHRETVARGINWLRAQQDPDSGLIGTRGSLEFLYDHVLATLALSEAYGFSKSPILRAPCQRAVDYIQRARNPYGAWRYEVPGNGESDTSVTGWVVFALQTAADSSLRVDPAALQGALSFLDEVTGADGRTGYTQVGQGSSRVPGVNDHYPREANETLTAVSLLCRIFLGQDPAHEPLLLQQAELLGKALPGWDPEGLTNDLYGWYYGTYSLFQLSGHPRGKRLWSAWSAALESALAETRRRDGDARGSWDPVGPWGHSGGRVYSTALAVLTLEVRYRYARIR